MFSARFLSFSTGFLSLSLEILWIRLFSFANHSLPQAFAFVLIFYLVGIAIGAYIGKIFCEKSRNLWKISGLVLAVSSLSDFTCPWIYVKFAMGPHQLIIGACVITLTALLKAIIFPIAHHLGTPTSTNRIGQSISRVYVANIIGSTLGPLVTGILLLTFFTAQQGFFICAGLTMMLAMYCWKNEIGALALMTCALTVFVLMYDTIAINRDSLISTLANFEMMPIKRIIENEFGIIVTYSSKNDDVVTGGNVYDGRTNLDPAINSNGLNRVIILAALQKKPANVLMIGLSIGTWLKLVTTFPGVKKIDVIEINPGYLAAINDYPAQKSALDDPRVHLYIDDGRRWLRSHPDNKYDLIIMNTTYYWRAYASNLLSQNFLSLIKQHMNTDAILTYNTTNSPDAFKTAASVFKYAFLYENFVIAANFDWRKRLRQSKTINTLSALKMDGKLLFPTGSKKIIKAYLKTPIIPLAKREDFFNALGRELEIITDDNLITEYKYGKSL